MRFVVAGMMIVFLLAGLVILGISLRELLRKWTRRHRFERADGVIVGVQKRTSTGTNRPKIMNFPMVTFKTRAGRKVTATMETGDGGRVSRYVTGQTLAVRYDPGGEFKPMMDSWSGVWLPNLMGVVCGGGMLFGAFLIYWAFGDRIMGR